MSAPGDPSSTPRISISRPYQSALYIHQNEPRGAARLKLCTDPAPNASLRFADADEIASVESDSGWRGLAARRREFAAETGLDTDVGRDGNQRYRCGTGGARTGLAGLTIFAPAQALAVEIPTVDIVGIQVGLAEILLISVTAGLGFAAYLAFRALIRERGDDTGEEASERIAELSAALDKTRALLATDDQKSIIWDTADASPEVIGSLPDRLGVPYEPKVFLSIGAWLQEESGRRLEELVVRLRRMGEAFQIPIRTKSDEILEVTGRTAGKRVIVRFRELSGERKSLAELQEQTTIVVSELTALRNLVDSIPFPAWRRNLIGKLEWVNAAYGGAVETAGSEAVIAGGVELLSPQTQDAIRDSHRMGKPFSNTVTAIVEGNRRRLDIIDIPLDDGSVGVAVDTSEIQVLRDELSAMVESNARTLDQLTAGVASFNADRRLLFSNAAFNDLWELPKHLTERNTNETAILDHLRAERKLPEQANFREWKGRHLGAYSAPESREELWHLPDSRTLRMVCTPNSENGLTYIFENVTEQLSLESRVNALSRIQGETLDHLSEGVAVFGTDGRLRLHNPAFAEIWGLSSALLKSEPHINEVIAGCAIQYDDQKDWDAIRKATTHLDRRDPAAGRMERSNGSVVDFATVALPEGMTMIAFVDVTDSARVQRALSERNEALEAADRLKSEFVQHVSYELRSPLTSIIGFTEMLSDETIGPLNAQQRDYMDHIATSSSSLLTIINDILDLATFDAGIMTLEVEEVEISAMITSAVEGLRDRIDDQRLALTTDLDSDIGSIHADKNRMKQILFNILANAIRFSDKGGSIEIVGKRENGFVELIVRDDGVGIPDDVLPTVFAAFESHAHSGHRKGAGLGLSIVKSLVDLHGGSIDIQSADGEGTTVLVRLPERPDSAAAAAE